MNMIGRQDTDSLTNLFQIKDPPKKLFCHGDLTLFSNRPLISVVGARDIKPWVEEWMEFEFGAVVRQLQMGVVSGGARGVDQVAHRIAIRAGCPTLVFLPSGLGQIYPKSLMAWQKKKEVCFVSEYEHDESMRKYHFIHRNRLIVGASPVTLVVQASEKSGSMMSARLALENGRTLVTLPGNPVDSAFSGNNQLLYEGALMVRNRHDLLQIMLSFKSSSCDAGVSHLPVEE